MNPKLKLILVLAIPIVWVSLWVFSLFKLLSPADVTGSEQTDNTISGQQANEIVNLTGNNTNILSTWTTQTATGTIKKPTIKVLKIAMPIWSYNEPGWRPIINKLAQQNIKLQIITNTWDVPYPDFTDSLFKDWATGADIILTDDQSLDKYQDSLWSFWFSQDISSLFHSSFFEYFARKDFTFIPFGIDPLVTFAKTPIQENVQALDRDTIVNNSVSDLDERKIDVQIPILFGLSNLDLQLIKNKKEIYEGYTDILKNILYQSVNRSQLIDTLKAYSNEALEVKIWDLAKYKRVSAKLIERNPKCGIYPKLCFMYYGLTNFSFWYLSEVDILNGYFEKSDYTIYNFPTSTSIYPVRLRGWVVNKNNYDSTIKPDGDGVSIAWIFFQEYINQATNGNHYLRPTLFSAFNAVLDDQQSDVQRKYISQYQSKRQVNPIQVKTDEQYKQFLALLKGEYDINVFLSGLTK